MWPGVCRLVNRPARACLPTRNATSALYKLSGGPLWNHNRLRRGTGGMEVFIYRRGGEECGVLLGFTSDSGCFEIINTDVKLSVNKWNKKPSDKNVRN